MIEPVFVDTNVFLYAVDSADIAKQRAARTWLDALWRGRIGRTSFQVLQEFYVNVARKWPDQREKARGEIRELLSWRPAHVNARVLETGWALQDRHSLSFWDALIVAAAQELGCRYLLTEDLQTGTRINGIRVISPFTATPALFNIE